MKWVTRDHIHMDRVASPWLIRRFIDKDAEFLFIPFVPGGNVAEALRAAPTDAIPFALPGVEIGPHDASGSTFRKLLRKYALNDQVLQIMAATIESGIEHVLHHQDPGYSVAQLLHPEGVGLDALAVGMMSSTANDHENLARSMAIYDALYDSCAARLLMREQPEIAALPVPRKWDEIKRELDRRRPW